METMHDFGMLNAVLEAEMAHNNLTLELMREEAMEILTEAEKKTSKVKEKIQKVLKQLQEFWNKFVSVVANAVNKIIASTNMAKKFITKNKESLSGFAGSQEKVKVTRLIAQPNLVQVNLGLVKRAVLLADTFIQTHILLRSEKAAMNNIKEMLNTRNNIMEQLVVNNTQKEDVALTKDLVDEAVKFLTTDYAKTKESIKSIKDRAGKVIKKSTETLKTELNQQGLNEQEVEANAMVFVMASKAISLLLMNVSAKFVAMMNTCYVDYLKICNKAVSYNKANPSTSTKEKRDYKERKSANDNIQKITG